MSSKLQRQIISGFGLEDESEMAPVIEINVDENGTPLDTSETPEADMVEVEEGANDTEEATDTVEEIQEDQETLESIAIALRGSAANGGMTRGEAAFMQIAFDAVARKRGIDTTQALPSLESFGGTGSRLSNTQISMESVKSAIIGFWQALKRQLVRAWDIVKGFMIKVFDGAKGLKSKAEAIKTKVGNLGTKVAKETKFKFGQAEKLGIGAAPAAPAKIIADLAMVKSIAASVLGEGPVKAEEKASAALTSSTGAEVAGPLQEAVQSTAKVSHTSAITAGYNPSLKVEGTAEMLGGMRFVTIQPKGAPESGAYAQYVRQSSAGFEEVKGERKEVTKEVATADASQMTTICNEAIGICDVITKYRGAWSEREKTKAKTMADCEKLLLKLSEDKSEAGVHVEKDQASGSIALLSMMSRTASNVTRYSLSTVSASLNYAAGSLGQYKEPEKKA
jgi:hypothetical protein